MEVQIKEAILANVSDTVEARAQERLAAMEAVHASQMEEVRRERAIADAAAADAAAKIAMSAARNEHVAAAEQSQVDEKARQAAADAAQRSRQLEAKMAAMEAEHSSKLEAALAAAHVSKVGDDTTAAS